MLGQLFDPAAELLITEQCRPHWAQAGAIVFVTFRTRDSIPTSVMQRWEREKRDWLIQSGVRFKGPVNNGIEQLEEGQRRQFRQHFNRCREDLLDNNLGECVLKQARLAKIVADALLYFDGQRYRMGDFIIMPNHAHLLCAFPNPDLMRKQFDSWLHYTAVQINKQLGTRGRFWQREPFDHLVRSPEQYGYLRKYISENPDKAGLKQGEFLYHRYER